MDILSNRTLIHPVDLQRSRRFYRDVLGLAVKREFGPRDAPGTVFYCGNGEIEVSGESEASEVPALQLWMQVRDVTAEYTRLAEAGVTTLREPKQEFWGLIEAWIADPDGIRIVLVQIPADHPLRRDQRSL